MTIVHLGNLIIYIGAVVTAMTGILFAGRWVIVRPLKKWIEEQIQPVKDEVSRNGGSSMKDSSVRTEEKVDALAESLLAHITDHPGQSRGRWR